MSIIFYHVFLWAYRMGIGAIAPWNRKARSWLEGRKGLFERIQAELSAAAGRAGPETGRTTGSQAAEMTGKYPVIWMHCSSLGEFEQGRPVLERLRAASPACKVIISFFSPSGFEARKDYEGADHVFYLPLDSKKNARRFIDLIRPDLVIWIKYDYWYYFLVELKKRRIPTLLVSGIFRPDQPFFKWWGRLHRYMLECFTHLFVQTDGSRQLLETIGFGGNVSISGDTRFDRVIEIAEDRESLPVIEAFCRGCRVIVAGSTWEEDEEELDHYANTHPELRFIIAPHDIDEDRIKEVEKLFRHRIRYSELVTSYRPLAAGGSRPVPNVLIIDNIGMLSRLYQYATITYVGGGFGDDGVHNVLEAAVYGRPVVFGPVIEKYIEAVELTECGGGIVIDSALEAESVFNRLLNNEEELRQASEASRNYVYARKGATDLILNYIISSGWLVGKM